MCFWGCFFISPVLIPLFSCVGYLITQGGGGGEITREKVIGAINHKAGRKY
jgi:hypothetical protein